MPKELPPGILKSLDVTKIGDEHYYAFIDDTDGNKIGIYEWHDCNVDSDYLNAGAVIFDIPETSNMQGPKWQVHSLDPLHLEPSILCRVCQNHGFIRNGKWENA